MTLRKIMITAAIALSVVSTAVVADDIPADVPTKYKNLFVFKTEKEFVGATVEILSASGEVITSQNLLKRKLIIDFADVKFGTYTIRVSKGDKTQEFQYIKQ